MKLILTIVKGLAVGCSVLALLYLSLFFTLLTTQNAHYLVDLKWFAYGFFANPYFMTAIVIALAAARRIVARRTQDRADEAVGYLLLHHLLHPEHRSDAYSRCHRQGTGAQHNWRTSRLHPLAHHLRHHRSWRHRHILVALVDGPQAQLRPGRSKHFLNQQTDK